MQQYCELTTKRSDLNTPVQRRTSFATTVVDHSSKVAPRTLRGSRIVSSAHSSPKWIRATNTNPQLARRRTTLSHPHRRSTTTQVPINKVNGSSRDHGVRSKAMDMINMEIATDHRSQVIMVPKDQCNINKARLKATIWMTGVVWVPVRAAVQRCLVRLLVAVAWICCFSIRKMERK